MSDNICRLCRREGVKLFLKGAKCDSPKCPLSRRTYAPGQTGAQKRFTKMSDFGTQLREKQKARRSYNLREKQFKKIFLEANRSRFATSQRLLQLLEARLDNAVFRAGFAPSRKAARQLVNHAKISLNGKKVSIPSIQLKPGDKITAELPKNFKSIKVKPPQWIKLNKKNAGFEIISQPAISPDEAGLNVQLIVEYYSR